MKTQLRRIDLIAHSALTLVGLSGVFAIFLPVAFGTSPWNGIGYAWQIALPFFLPPFIAAASVQWIMTGSFWKLEYLLACVLSMAVSFLPVWLFIEAIYPDAFWPSIKELLNEWPLLLIWLLLPLSIICFDTYCLLPHRKHRIGEYSVVMVLQMAYLPTAGICFLILFDEAWNSPGAGCAVIAMSAYIAQAILVKVKGNH
jgi:hypothetical protein